MFAVTMDFFLISLLISFRRLIFTSLNYSLDATVPNALVCSGAADCLALKLCLRTGKIIFCKKKEHVLCASIRESCCEKSFLNLQVKSSL